MITTKQMRNLERFALTKGILPIYLMENAGRGVFEEVKAKYDLVGKHVIIFAGSGNNGGDGLVAARYFAKECQVIVFLFADRLKLTQEAQENYEKIRKNVNVVPITSKEDLMRVRFQERHDLIFIDALMGLGFQGEVKELMQTAIEFFNAKSAIKVAVDIPSGLNADTGEGSLFCVVDLIVTFHDLKVGLEKLKDKTVVVDIGIPYFLQTSM